MSPIPRTYTFTVRGQGLFPFDMLRHDRCCPARETDSAAIERTTRRPSRTASGGTLEERVTLVGPKSPTEGRWGSFGWLVESVQ